MRPWTVLWNSELRTYTASISVELAAEGPGAYSAGHQLGLNVRDLGKKILEEAEQLASANEL